MRRITLLLALALAACSQPQPEGPARPALWKLSDADTTIYLFGTIHLLPRGYDWKSPKIEAAIRASQALTLEAVIDDATSDAGQVLADLATDSAVPSVEERITPDQKAALAAAIARSGLPRAQFDAMETWAVALVLAQVQLRGLPASTDYGVETQLKEEFRRADKPVDGFETLAEQLGYFDALPYPAQARFLRAVLADDKDPRAEYDAMIAAWRAGDLAKIAATFDDEAQLSPELKDALLVQRNRRWTEALAARLAQPGVFFVAVGAGHLAGPESVQAMLGAKGLKVERLQ